MTEETRIIGYSERRDIKSAASGILSDVGFTSELGVQMKRLNDTMAQYRKGSVERVRITLTPDVKNPMPVVETSFKRGYQTQLDVYPERGRARVQIGNGSQLLVYARLVDTQCVVRELLPDKNVRLMASGRGYVRRVISDGKIKSAIYGNEPSDIEVDENLLQLTTSKLDELPVSEYSIIADGLDEPLFVANIYFDSRLTECVFDIRSFAYSGAPKDVESAIRLVAELFDKHAMGRNSPILC